MLFRVTYMATSHCLLTKALEKTKFDPLTLKIPKGIYYYVVSIKIVNNYSKVPRYV